MKEKSMNPPPKSFCWTKMGEESGESLATIIQRKEWERQMGAGMFAWGIGQSLGRNVEAMVKNMASFPVLFSPMLSRAKKIDIEPGSVAIWTQWEDHIGNIHSLPAHVLVTSRATLPSGKEKKSHYALICQSDSPLQNDEISGIQHSFARNALSNKPVGASQVTAVVTLVNEEQSEVGKSYPVSFQAKLEYPYYVKLIKPRILSQDDVAAIKRVSSLGNIQSWKMLVQRLRDNDERLAEKRDQFDSGDHTHGKFVFA